MLKAARVYRDPVHDIISFKEEGRLGRVIASLVDARELQRLRFVRQLGLASLVYHGAEHSRFQHSLGVAHMARRIAHRLGSALDEDQRIEVVAAALLHDVGHGPFSHVMERVFGFHHEDWSCRIVRDPETEVHDVLSQVDPALPERVARRISGGVGDFADAIVSGQLDADRLDYLLRDAHMTGVGVGRYDLERILLMLGHDEYGLTVQAGGYEAIEGYLIARYHMYRLVYFHRTVRAAEAMLKSVFARARDLMASGDGEVSPGGTLGRLLGGEQIATAQWTSLGDHHAWFAIERWRDHGDPVLSMLAEGLLKRRLFKGIERNLEGTTLEEEDALVDRIRASLAPGEAYLFCVDDAGDTPYRPYRPGALQDIASSIRIREKDGRLFRIEERSPVVSALARAAYRFRRWYVHPTILSRLKFLDP